MTEGAALLMRTDPSRDLDRVTQQVFGTNGTPTRPAIVPMDAWRENDTFVVEFDLPGANTDAIGSTRASANASCGRLRTHERGAAASMRPPGGMSSVRFEALVWVPDCVRVGIDSG